VEEEVEQVIMVQVDLLDQEEQVELEEEEMVLLSKEQEVLEQLIQVGAEEQVGVEMVVKLVLPEDQV
jgi:hypothetical protein